MTDESEEQFCKRVRKELVDKYAIKGSSNVTFVDFRRIHDEYDYQLKLHGFREIDE